MSESITAYHAAGGNVAAAARSLGISRSTLWYRLRKEGVKLDKPLAGGQIRATDAEPRALPRRGHVKRYVLTSAQNNTHVHPEVWKSLQRLSEAYGAELLVGTFTYNKAAYGKMSVKQGTKQAEDNELWYDPQIEPFIADKRLELAKHLWWCGEMNIMPTAVDPLSGLETYTHRASGIFPAAKIALRSIAAGTKTQPTKFNYTTGCCTQRNYLQKKAGLKAEHYHTYGGLVVEVDDTGAWWVRQVHCSSDGTLYDLDWAVINGVASPGHAVAAITWGDSHELMMAAEQREVTFDMSRTLRPKYHFVNDLLLGSVTNHWEAHNTHERFRRMILGGGFSDFTEELRSGGEFLRELAATGGQVMVVDSNHDRPWIERWLRDKRGMEDPKNVELWHRLNAAMLASIREHPYDPSVYHALEHGVSIALGGIDFDVKFLREDESFQITKSKIECGMHGHLGTNGSRGTPAGLARVGNRANIGHFHGAEIRDGLYVAGTSCKTDMIYNRGPSSWSNSHIITYPNGKRSIVTVWNGEWAPQV